MADIRAVLRAFVELVALLREVWALVKPAVAARAELERRNAVVAAARKELIDALRQIEDDIDGSGAAVGVGSVLASVLPEAAVDGAARGLDERELREAAAFLGIPSESGVDAVRGRDGGDPEAR